MLPAANYFFPEPIFGYAASMALRDWVKRGRELGASDLHVEAGAPLLLRIRSELRAGGAPLEPAVVMQAARDLLGTQGWEQFLQRGSADISRNLSGVRCRVNVYQTIRGIALAIRLLSSFQNSLRSCNLHPDLAQLVVPTTGLVVLSGATGSGKSTTLSALIEEINRSSAKHILSIESPIEYLFTNRRSFIRQREVPTHTPSFEQALTDALRENPDVLVIGEMRTPEVMRLTLNAAETGHLVIATMHSANCAEALARFCMSFSAEIQPAVRAQLADTLVGMVCQRLEFLGEHGIRVPVCELLLGTAPAKGTIRAGQFSQIPSVLQTGGEAGMWNFERYQRWVAAKTDWVQPSVSDTLPVDPQPSSQPPVVRTAAANTSGDSVEIPVEEVDLDELARRIETRGT